MLALITYPSAIEDVGISNLFVFKMGKKHLCGNSWQIVSLCKCIFLVLYIDIHKFSSPARL